MFTRLGYTIIRYRRLVLVGALGMLVIILLVRPQGLLGRKERIG